jgi:prepilin-type N-terminal cleavage/methylation domain-containing protein
MLNLRVKRKRLQRVKAESGFSLVEVIMAIVIMGIAVVPISRLAILNLTSGARYTTMTKALFYAQSGMEQLFSDYGAKNDGRGYAWVRSNWPGTSTPATGFTRTVTISAQQTLNSVNYVVVHVQISSAGIPTVDLSTWLIQN